MRFTIYGQSRKGFERRHPADERPNHPGSLSP
jgi:hypothetical protein